MSKVAKKQKTCIVEDVEAPYRTKTSVRRRTGSLVRTPVKQGESKNRTSLGKTVASISKENKNSIVYWLGGNTFLENPMRSDFDLLSAGVEGIAKASVDALAVHMGVNRKYIAEDIFDLSVKTLERKSPADKLDRRTSSQAIEIAKLMQHAYEVFEDEEKLRRWINKENRALGGMKPVSLFSTLTGLNMVNTILGRIEEGVYS